MTARRHLVAIIAAFSLAAALASTASATPAAPAWALTLTPLPANFAPGAQVEFLLYATNVGADATSSPSYIEATLPEALTPLSVRGSNSTPGTSEPGCAILAQTVRCEAPDSVGSGREFFAQMKIQVASSPSGGSLIQSTVGGGGAPSASATISPPLQGEALPFSIQGPGLSAPLTEPDGSPATLAGSHPYQQTISFGFPIEAPETHGLSNSGHPRDVALELPRGMIGDPAASSVLCTGAQFEGEGCPVASQVGVFELDTLAGEVGNNGPFTTPLFSLVPPPGVAAEFGTNAGDIGFYVHILAGLRSDGDYGIEVNTPDIIALGSTPIFSIQTQLWGDPSATVHDPIRGRCSRSIVEVCPAIAPQRTAFLTLPGDCPGNPLPFAVRADSWEQPGTFVESTYDSADLAGDPVSVGGCSALEFQPTIEARPTTNLTDSPSGLDVELHQPQNTDKEQRSTAQLRDATVTLPEGMSVNPSQAGGLNVCNPAQIGLLTQVGQGGPIHLSKQPAACPDAAKLGTVDVTSPLLVQRDASHKLELDPETGEPLPEPLHGSVYLAKPYENPFGSLLAIYLDIEDPQTGIVAKLAGKVTPDPQTGQLTTTFTENPELPIEDISLHLFGGARGALITPPTCGATNSKGEEEPHATTTDLIPWSAPETPDAHPSSGFSLSAAPGGPCARTGQDLPNAPTFTAGTLSPQAAAYSPFVLKLSRADGTQRLTGFDTTLPPGLTGKLAGVGECSEAQLARAASRSNPEEGILERRDPSCPAASRLGTVDVAAGAGPTPFNTQGTAYLAGPYKGAPVSMAVITPAIAGPFDLGTVVVRVALYVDPDTARIHAVSDPLPTILDGIPLDVRSIAVKLDKPDFTLNPTSCDPMKITGSALSTLGQSAALANPFQVGGCPQLPFKPKLSLKLKGGTKRASHPKLIATLKAKPGEANVASAQVKLPPSAFLDQAHIRTVCTRVQFAADSCPKGSIYGTASAVTPLLSDPLSGNVYLRSSNHKLPDLVVALKGPASLPIEIDLDGKTDSVKGALRNTFEAVPDAPVSSFRLELFGGKRGLVVNSRNLCAHSYRAEVNLDGQNGKVFDTKPAVGTDCRKGRKGKGKRHAHGR